MKVPARTLRVRWKDKVGPALKRSRQDAACARIQKVLMPPLAVTLTRDPPRPINPVLDLPPVSTAPLLLRPINTAGLRLPVIST